MLFAFLVGWPSAAQSQSFYGAVAKIPPLPSDGYEKGRSIALIGLHPTAGDLAMNNACVPAITQYAFEIVKSECLEARYSLKCDKGGYFAVAEYQAVTQKIADYAASQGTSQARLENAIGMACGKKTLAVAKAAASEACEKTRKARGLPEAGTIQSAYSQSDCTNIVTAGLNDGKYQGQVVDFLADSKRMGRGAFFNVQLQCWGSNTESTKFLPCK